MLKHTAHSIAPSLTKLFNLSIRTGQVPCDWKTSSVVPIPKSSGPSDCITNYRPISQLSVVLYISSLLPLYCVGVSFVWCGTCVDIIFAILCRFVIQRLQNQHIQRGQEQNQHIQRGREQNKHLQRGREQNKHLQRGREQNKHLQRGREVNV